MELKGVAYLGPQGSYTELALRAHFRVKSPRPCASIAEVFRQTASGESDLGFVPIENMLQGHVTETLDLLSEYRHQIRIIQSRVLQVAHCLGVLPERADCAPIAQIYSKDQALQQCSRYLREHYPDAEQCATSSTSAAAERIRSQRLIDAACIASEEILTQCGLRVVARNIADRPDNRTRFILLARSDSAAEEQLPPHEAHAQFVTSVLIDPGRDRQGILFEILEIISVRHAVNLLSIHSRPDMKGGFLFHLDLEGSIHDAPIANCLRELEEYCRTATGETAELVICGSYAQEPFHQLPFRTIGIIGGQGAMGRWFTSFFAKLGLEVLTSDREEGVALENLMSRSDVVVLSVPMSAVAGIAPRLKALASPGQLIVENCSIKGCALPVLLETLPEGVEVLGIHTMFGGDRTTLKGENVIITATPRSGEKAQAFEDLFYKHGANLTRAPIGRHDSMSALLQALVQFMMVSFGEVVRQSVASPAELEPFSTPNSRAALTVMQRVLGQSHELLRDLQMLNQEYPKTRHLFLQTVFRLTAALDHADVDEFLRSAAETRRFFDRHGEED